MKIGEKEIKEILIMDDEGTLLVSINDENIISDENINAKLIEVETD